MVYKAQSLQRREFLSRVSTAGTAVIIGMAAAPVLAMERFMANDGPADGPKAVSLSDITPEDFAGLVGEDLWLRNDAGTMARGRLLEVSRVNAGGKVGHRRQFSIVFDVTPGMNLTQGHYRMGHPQLGNLELFMVPVDLPAKYNRLEAVFA